MFKKLKYYLKNQKFKRRQKSFPPHTKGIIYKTENGIIAMSHEDMLIGKHLGYRGSWNLPKIDALKQIVKPTDHICFVGTHVGTLLVPIAKTCKQVTGYEANPDTVWFVEQNARLNGLDNVQLFNYAVGDEEKKIIFYQSKINTGGSKIKPLIDDFRYSFDNPDKIEVQMIPLDAHITSQNLEHPDGIIMDIEGAEFFALKGMPETLKQLRFLYMEYVPHHLKNVSATTNAELIQLIAPHFHWAIVKNRELKIDISENTDALQSYLDGLDRDNRIDDLLFTKQ